MSVNKKYFYLKFRENYFEQDHIKVIESMKNGYEYSLIILKLYLKSLKWEGQLMINEKIPYQADKIDILAGVLGHDPANVMHAINLAKDLGVMEVLSTGDLFMSDIQSFIGHSSSEAERKTVYRKKLEGKKRRDKNGTLSQKRPPELELDIELDLDKELDKDIKKEVKIRHHDAVLLTSDEYNKLIEKLGEKEALNYIEKLNNYILSKGKKYKSHYHTILNWTNMARSTPAAGGKLFEYNDKERF